jgi:hypothetical protein
MMLRDEAWERRAAVSHAHDLRQLLAKGQNLDVDVEGVRGNLRGFLLSLKAEIEKALGS